MKKIYKYKNVNLKKISLYFVLQVILGTMPVLLLIIFVYSKLNQTHSFMSLIFIGAILACGIGNVIVAKKYNVLLSGLHGEKSLLKAVKKLNLGYDVFVNVPIRYKRNKSELDVLLVGQNGIIAIEAKNHSGTLCGHFDDMRWIQKKVYRDGKTTELDIYNPLRQMKKQREILKSILRANGLEVWVESVLYLSSPMIRTKLVLRESDYVFSTEEELVAFLKEYKPKKRLSREETAKIISILKELPA